MYLPFFISRRYLFAKKSRNIINDISIISAAGIMIGTMALVVVLSVYNGMDGFIKSLYNTFDANIRITLVEGKVFSPNTANFMKIREMQGIGAFAEVLEENALLQYGPRQELATIKGVDSVFVAATPIRNAVIEGEFKLYFGQVEEAVLGVAIARKLQVGLYLIDPIVVYIPRRTGSISLLNPEESLMYDRLYPAGIFEIEKSFDTQYAFVPIDFARRLLEYTDEVSAVEIFLQDGVSEGKIQKEIEKILGAGFRVQSRYQQQESVYNMMASEKIVVYIILIFIYIIVSFNALGSLAMIIIDKKKDIETLRSMGADHKLLSRIFILEGWMVSLLGIFLGIILGLLLCYAQQYIGIIRMPGNFLFDYYPVKVVWGDILLALFLVAVIGFIIACVPVHFINKPARQYLRKN